MAFSPSDAAFEGFRLARRQPLTVAALCVVSFATVMAIYGMMEVTGYWQALAALAKITDPREAVEHLAPLFRFALGSVAIICLVSALQSGAVYRGVLRPADRGVLGVAVGADEFRLLALAVALVLLGMLVLIALMIALSIVLTVSGLSRSPQLMELITDSLVFGMAVWLGTRMSFAGPATFARRRITVFGSWGLTRGHFASLLGCYVLTVFLAMLVGFIGFVVGIVVASLATGTPFTTALGEFFGGPGAMVDLFTPVRIVYSIINALFGGLLTMVLTAPAAEAYRQLHGGGEAEAFS